MIEIEVHGRLGNHLFQYAFALSASRQLNTKFRFRHAERLEIEKYFTLPSYNKKYLDRFPRLERVFKRILSPIRKVVVVEDSHTWVDLEDNVTYKGFYQSYNFFRDHEESVRKEFTFKKEYIEVFKSKYEDLFKNKEVIGVHVRRGDYLDVNIPELGSKGLQLPISYYERCLSELDTENSIVFFASDDISYVKDKFGLQPNYIYSNNDVIVDFITLCKVDKLIISNSSFSWWTGFLNTNCTKVYAPKHHLGFKVGKTVPAGIMYEGFEWVDVIL